jgi:hypothetical protein
MIKEEDIALRLTLGVQVEISAPDPRNIILFGFGVINR